MFRLDPVTGVTPGDYTLKCPFCGEIVWVTLLVSGNCLGQTSIPVDQLSCSPSCLGGTERLLTSPYCRGRMVGRETQNEKGMPERALFDNDDLSTMLKFSKLGGDRNAK